jgi:hypothetical protein
MEQGIGMSMALPRFGSARSNDADYDPLIVRIGKRYDVLLNGRPITKVIAYNCDEGWIRRFLTDSRGKIRLFPIGGPGQRGSNVREETLVGQVTVRWR